MRWFIGFVAVEVKTIRTRPQDGWHGCARIVLPPNASHAHVTCVLADIRPGTLSTEMRRRLLCLYGGRSQCASRESSLKSSCQWPVVSGQGLPFDARAEVPGRDNKVGGKLKPSVRMTTFGGILAKSERRIANGEPQTAA